MTLTDLHLLYKRETGNDVFTPDNLEAGEELDLIEQIDLINYFQWLEEKLLHLQNQLEQTNKFKYGG